MSDAIQPTGAIPAANVKECVARSISKDGATAMMVFKIEDGTQFALTVPVASLGKFRSMVNDVCDDAQKSQLGTGMVQMKRPHSIEIGSSDQIRGHIAITFDRDMPEETIFLMQDAMGLDVSDAMQKNIFGRMTPEDRRARMARSGQILAPKKTLIIPGK
jgi:hypothetical protein